MEDFYYRDWYDYLRSGGAQSHRDLEVYKVIKNFCAENPNPSESDVNEISDQLGIRSEILWKFIRVFNEEKIMDKIDKYLGDACGAHHGKKKKKKMKEDVNEGYTSRELDILDQDQMVNAQFRGYSGNTKWIGLNG